ncbi:MAG: hypothetical protein M1561_02685 [Gammaproteobacteria bacterium]|nr:hypothetical protein [Gammaproteobacteria bacterium]
MALNAGDYTRGASLTATILLAAMTLSYFALSYFSLFTLRGVTITFPIVAFVFLAAQAINSYYEHDVLRKAMEDFDTVSAGRKKNPHLKVQITFLILRIAAAAFLVIAALFFPALILLGLTATLLVQVFSSYSIRRKFAIVVKKIGEDDPIAVRLNKYNLSAIPQIIIYFVAFAACLLALYPAVGLSGLFSAAMQSKVALSVIGVTGASFLGLIALKLYDISIYLGHRPSASSSSSIERQDSKKSVASDSSDENDETRRLINEAGASASISSIPAVTEKPPLSAANSVTTISYASIGESLSESKGSRTPTPPHGSPVNNAAALSAPASGGMPHLQLPPQQMPSASVSVSSIAQPSHTASATAFASSQGQEKAEDTESLISREGGPGRDTLGYPFDV